MDQHLEALLAEAAFTFGSLVIAINWVYSPCDFLDYSSPADMAKTEGGFNAAMEMLHRIQTTVTHSSD